MAGRHNRMVSTQWTRPILPGARPTGMEESDPVNGWPQRALSLWDMMMMSSSKDTQSPCDNSHPYKTNRITYGFDRQFSRQLAAP